MKKKVGIIASACAVSAICASLIVGSTYALFTSESKVNISVTAGNVNVVANVGNLTASTSLDKDYSVTGEGEVAFQNGGSASVTGGVVTLNKIVPGDTLTFPINVTNNSNVSIKSRISYNVENGYLLASGLSVKVDGDDSFSGKQEYATPWSELKETYTVTISLPNNTDSNIDNLYQGLSTNISFAVEAVQSNGASDGGEVSVDLPDYTGLKNKFIEGAEVVKITAKDNFFEALNNNAIVILTEDVQANRSKNPANPNSNVTLTEDKYIALDGYTFDTNVCYFVREGADLYVSGGEWNTTLAETSINQAFSVWGDADGTSLTLDGVTLNSKIYGVAIRNCVWTGHTVAPVVNIKNCVINCEDAYGSALATDGTLGHTNTSNVNYHEGYEKLPLYVGGTVNIDNTVISSNGAGITLTAPVDLNLKNSVINSKMQCVVARGGNVTISGCTLNNSVYKDELKAMIADNHGGFKYINKTYELGVEGVAETKYWNSANDVDLAAIVVGNNVDPLSDSYKYPASLTVTDTVINTYGDFTDKVSVNRYRDEATFNYSYSADFAGAKLDESDIITNGEHTNVKEN